MKKLICFILLLFLIFLAIGGIIYFSKNVQKIFVYSQELEPAEVIVVLGGWRSKSRVEHGVDLYKKDYAPKIIMSDGYTVCQSNAAEIMKEYAIELGVPEKDILVERESSSTLEDALFVREKLKANSFRKIIIVTADFHSRRASKIFKKILGPDYKIISSPATVYNQEDWKNWWEKEELRKLIFMEIFKYAYFSFIQ